MDFPEKYGQNLQKVKLDSRDDELIVAISNPPANAIGRQVREELRAVLHWASREDEVRGITIRGEGRFFSGGADVKNELYPAVMSQNPRERAYRLSREGHIFLDFIRKFSKPVTAYIDGYALGGGLELALACGKIVVTRRSVLGLPELTLGIIPGWGGTVFFPRKLQTFPPQTGIGYIMQAILLTGKKAHLLGLADEFESIGDEQNISPAKPCSPTAQSYLSILRTSVPDYLTDVALDVEALLFSRICEHPDAKEGLSAFLEKREANFLKN